MHFLYHQCDLHASANKCSAKQCRVQKPYGFDPTESSDPLHSPLQRKGCSTHPVDQVSPVGLLKQNFDLTDRVKRGRTTPPPQRESNVPLIALMAAHRQNPAKNLYFRLRYRYLRRKVSRHRVLDGNFTFNTFYLIKHHSTSENTILGLSSENNAQLPR